MIAKSVAIVLMLLSAVSAEEAAKGDRSDFKKSFSADCVRSYSPTCLKLDIVSWIDGMSESADYSVLPGISVVREQGSARSNNDVIADLARDFPDDPDGRLDAFLVSKVSNYLGSHALKLDLWNGAGEGQARKGNNLRLKGGKKGNGLELLLAIGAMMKGTLGALALGGLAALAGKALLTGLISLLLSGIIGLKSLTGGGKSTTYEVIAKPVYTHANTHSVSHEEHPGHYGHSSYERSYNVPLPLGLQDSYKPPQ